MEPRPEACGILLDVAVRVAVCRTLTVTRDGTALSGPGLGTRKARVLLGVLAAARGAPVSVERLSELIWADAPPRDPQANLATLASRLRRVAGDALVVPGPASYALGPRVELDLDVAGDLLAAAAARQRRGEPTLAVASATRALALLGDGRLAEECGDAAEPLEREAAERCREARHLLAVGATTVGQTDLALAAATAATAHDPFDERAHRDLMRALVGDGRPSAALEVYRLLAARLSDELGADPDQETRTLQMAILRGTTDEQEPVRDAGPDSGALVGRDQELSDLDRAWSQAAAGAGSLLVVTGVPGIGKTRLLAEASALAARTGGLILTTVCRPAERSLFLQPFLDVLRPVLLAQAPGVLDTLVGAHLTTWARLLPELTEVLEVPSPPETSPELARRLSFDAVAAVLAGLSAARPVLVVLDDLQYAADATADLLGHLSARLATSPVLLLAGIRTEALPTLPQVTAPARLVRLGPLPPSAVDALAAAAGFAGRSAEVQARSLGHPLSVVAGLKALASGNDGVPDDLADAVAGMLDRVDPDAAEIARGAAVLGTRVDPLLLAALTAHSEVEVALACGRLTRAGLMSERGSHHTFANDLVRDAVRAALPRPVAVAYHRRAADLLADRPEEMAGHAHEAGESARAAGGYLQAGRTARRAGALGDALALLASALDDAQADGGPPLAATVLLERARAHEAAAAYAEAERDVLAARHELVGLQEPRLELRSLRLLGGDISVARGRPLDEVVDHNLAGALRASELGDTVGAAVFRTRLVVVACSRLRLSEAHDLAVAGVAESRASGSPEALARSLDGLKSVLAYLGDAAGLETVLDELLPLLRRLGATWLLQWAVLESALVPAAQGSWPDALDRVDRALELNHVTGYDAYAGYFRAQRAWLARLSGDPDAALSDGRSAVAAASPTAHPWWYATAVGVHASTLLGLGRREEAAALCRTGLSALGPQAGAAYQLRCLAPLAAAGGAGADRTDLDRTDLDRADLDRANRLLADVTTPPGRGWVLGADVYEAVASAWRATGEPDRAHLAVEPLLAVTGGGTWDTVHARLAQSSSPSS
jgi:DNA-binding SARP family transcriptional activator/tetratricopeptide (TPR) repeat protein